MTIHILRLIGVEKTFITVDLNLVDWIKKQKKYARRIYELLCLIE